MPNLGFPRQSSCSRLPETCLDSSGKPIRKAPHWSSDPELRKALNRKSTGRVLVVSIERPKLTIRKKNGKKVIVKRENAKGTVSAQVVETARNTIAAPYMQPLHSTRNTSIWAQHNKHLE